MRRLVFAIAALLVLAPPLLAQEGLSAFERARQEAEVLRQRTLAQIREQSGPEADLHFITGADAVPEILGWKDPQRLLALCQLIAAARPGYRLDRALSSLDPEMRSRIHALNIPGVAVSSTEMRARAAAGLPLTYLAPPEVVAYIAKHGLYASPKEVRKAG